LVFNQQPKDITIDHIVFLLQSSRCGCQIT
jgi:hypothetical protein